MVQETPNAVAQTTAHFLATTRYMAVLNVALLVVALLTARYVSLNVLLAAGLLYLHLSLIHI